MGKRTFNKFPTHNVGGAPIRNCTVDYVGYNVTDLSELIKDHSSYEEAEKLQCSYIYPNEKQCITRLNSSSIKNGSGRCDMHRNIEMLSEYSSSDSSWRCNIKGYRNKKCGKVANHREVLDGKEVFRCVKHLDEYLGYNT